eukprot:scaffold126767_cov69-Phaeocystis_antarctica.AAC.4
MSDVASDLSESISEVHGPRPCAPHLSLCTFLGISLASPSAPYLPRHRMHFSTPMLPHAPAGPLPRHLLRISPAVPNE